MTIEEMKRRKKELGYTNQQIADLSAVPFGTVQKIFSGATASPRYETLLKLERVLQKSPVIPEKPGLYAGIQPAAGSYVSEPSPAYAPAPSPDAEDPDFDPSRQAPSHTVTTWPFRMSAG